MSNEIDSSMKLLPYVDDKFVGYRNKSVQDFRFALSEGIRSQVFFATFVQNIETQIKSSSIINALKQLNFLDVRFEAEFEEKNPDSTGTDNVRFMISTNPGEDMKPLAKIASGGELSRIMLAIKSVMAETDVSKTLIFDEIDAGISGKTAQLVAEKLNTLSKTHQIICITHLPQIAAMADNHYVIEKSTKDNRTISNITKLSYDESIGELARMLGGSSITDAVVSNAKELKNMAQTAKNN